MRGAAIFRAGAAIGAGLGRQQRQPVHAAGDHVHLAAERGNPEGMDDVGALQQELDALADRQPDLVGGENRSAAVGQAVDDPPPELLAGHLDP